MANTMRVFRFPSAPPLKLLCRRAKRQHSPVCVCQPCATHLDWPILKSVRRVGLLLLWRLANYPIGAFGLYLLLNAASNETAYDEYGNEYNVDGGWLNFVAGGIGLAVLCLASYSAGKNKEHRDKSA